MNIILDITDKGNKNKLNDNNLIKEKITTEGQWGFNTARKSVGF